MPGKRGPDKGGEGGGRFLARRLNASEQGGIRILESLSWPTPLGRSLRLYVGAKSEWEILKPTPASPVQFTGLTRVGDNLLATGSAPAGDGSGPLVLDLGAERLTLNPAEPEPALFDDLDVILGQRHHESPAQVAAWLRYHVETHGAQGAVLLDRAPPDEGFAEALIEAASALDGLQALQRLVVVGAPLPLGALGKPAMGHPAAAPRAKDRRFTSDPWRAPLAEPLVFDILRWRFLARAGAVIALDPPDRLDPPADGVAVFDTVRASQTGMMPLRGEAIFPWRVRKGAQPCHEDHVCRADPAIAAPQRWAAAPRRLEATALWLPASIAGVSAVADEVLRYDRAMGLVCPGVDVAALVNKDLLVLDEGLADAAARAGHKPIVPPPRPRALPAAALPPPPSGRTLIVTCMKNEGPFILEWIAYHRMIGVDDFLIYTNDCDDGTVELLDLLQARGIVQRRDNPFRRTGTRKPQQAALDAARSEPLVQGAGWIVSMDVDEFINVHVGANRLPDLYAAVGEASLISMTWRLFGNSDIAEYRDEPVTRQFTRCAPRLIRRPHQAWGFKTLFRNQGLFDSFGVHRPRGYRGGQALWVNGSGKPMPPRLFKTGWRSEMDTYGYDLVTLNHYAVRSAESFLVKRDRGRVNHVDRDQGLAYWFRMNNNDEQDLSIQRHAQGLQEALAELMADRDIAAAHAACVAAHRARIAALRARPDYARLFEALTSERMRRLSRMHRHFGLNVFLAGPSVVPDRVFEPDLPENFFFNVAPPQGKAAE